MQPYNRLTTFPFIKKIFYGEMIMFKSFLKTLKINTFTVTLVDQTFCQSDLTE